MGCCAPLLRRAARDGETAREAELKGQLLPALAGMLVVALVSSVDDAMNTAAWFAERDDPRPDGPTPLNMGRVGTWLCAALLAVWVPAVTVTRHAPLWSAELLTLSLGVVVVFIDWGLAQQGDGEAWALGVLLMDVLLLIDARPGVTHALLGTLTAWVCAHTVEDCVGVGLWRFPYDTGRSRAPIGADQMPVMLILRLMPFVLDFWFTRNFAHEMRIGRETVQAAVEMAESVTAHLSLYETECAQHLIDSEEGDKLPPMLRRALRDLVNNLCQYKPYLPHHLVSRRDTFPQLPGLSEQSSSIRGEARKHVDVLSDSSLSSTSEQTQTPDELTSNLSSIRGSRMSSFRDGEASPQAVGGRRSRRPEASPRAHSPRAHSPRAQSMSPRSQHSRRKMSRIHSHPTGTSPRHQKNPSSGAHVRAEPTVKLATILAANRKGFLATAANSPSSAVSAFLATEVAFTAARVSAHRGVIDLVCADRSFCNFGVARLCLAHRASAVAAMNDLCHRDKPGAELTGVMGVKLSPAAQSRLAHQRDLSAQAGPLASLAFSSAVCTGQALCGDFGSAELKRYAVIGGVSSLVCVVERLATRRGVPMLVDAQVYNEAEAGFDCRARELVVYQKRGLEHPQLLWQVVAEKRQMNQPSPGARQVTSSQNEWMYQTVMHPNPWALYNDTVLLWTAGEGRQARAKAEEAREALAPAVSAALRELRPRLTDGAMPKLLLADFSESYEQRTTREHRRELLADFADDLERQESDVRAAPGPHGDTSVSTILGAWREQQDAMQHAREQDQQRQRQRIEETLQRKRVQKEPCAGRLSVSEQVRRLSVSEQVRRLSVSEQVRGLSPLQKVHRLSLDRLWPAAGAGGVCRGTQQARRESAEGAADSSPAAAGAGAEVPARSARSPAAKAGRTLADLTPVIPAPPPAGAAGTEATTELRSLTLTAATPLSEAPPRSPARSFTALSPTPENTGAQAATEKPEKVVAAAAAEQPGNAVAPAAAEQPGEAERSQSRMQPPQHRASAPNLVAEAGINKAASASQLRQAASTGHLLPRSVSKQKPKITIGNPQMAVEQSLPTEETIPTTPMLQPSVSPSRGPSVSPSKGHSVMQQPCASPRSASPRTPVMCQVPGDLGGCLVLTLKRKRAHDELGLRLDAASMKLRFCEAGSIASQHEQLSCCVGLVLTSVNDRVVNTPGDVFAAAAGCLEIRLRFMVPIAAASAGELVVELRRPSFATWAPWGLVLDQDTMQLLHCTTGSYAYDNEQCRDCIGMVLGKVGGVRIHNTAGFSRQSEGLSTVRLHFFPVGTNIDQCGSAAGSPHPPSSPVDHHERKKTSIRFPSTYIRTSGRNDANAKESQALDWEDECGPRLATKCTLDTPSGEAPREGSHPFSQSHAALIAAAGGPRAGSRASAGRNPTAAPPRPPPATPPPVGTGTAVDSFEEFVVRITRRSFEAWVPWGIVVGKTMHLLFCTTGSVASGSPDLCECIGLLLTKVNDYPVHCPQEVKDASEECLELALTFRRQTIPGHGACELEY